MIKNLNVNICYPCTIFISRDGSRKVIGGGGGGGVGNHTWPKAAKVIANIYIYCKL